MKRTRREQRGRRHRRIRRKISGTSERARLAVFRSHLHIYAQIVDDTKWHILAAASSLKLESAPSTEKESRRIGQAKAVGRAIAERAKEKGIEKVALDRGGYRYHGRVAALAEAAREGGLQF